MIADPETQAPGIAIVRSSRSWARTLHRYVVDHGGAIVRTRPLEERQAIEDEYDILIVDDISSFLTAHIVDELHRRGRRILGVFDPDEHSASADQNTGKARLLRLGADGTIESQASPEEFVRVINALAPPAHERQFHNVEADIDLLTRDFTLEGFGQVSQQSLVPGGNRPMPAVPSAPRRRGHITAVFGVSGGNGATEIAVELARALGKRGERTIVVDGDELAPSLAQRLHLSLHPNLRTAVDVVEHGTGRLSECLTAIATGLEVLVGIPHPRDWVELRGSEMRSVLDELSRGRPQVVVNVAPEFEDLTMFGGADRFGVSRTVINAADSLVIVCNPTPTGIARLVDRVADLSTIAANKPIHVVINRTPKGRFKKKEISTEIQRAFKPASIHFLPTDPHVEKAAWEGTLASTGEFTKAISSSLAPSIPKVVFPSPKGRAKTGAQVPQKRA